MDASVPTLPRVTSKEVKELLKLHAMHFPDIPELVPRERDWPYLVAITRLEAIEKQLLRNYPELHDLSSNSEVSAELEGIVERYRAVQRALTFLRTYPGKM